MRQISKNPTRLALASLLGLALTASVGLAGAQTQDGMKRGKRDTTKATTTTRADDRSSTSNMESDEYGEDRALPAPMSYPLASPGGIDLFHWTDYSRMHLREGSATERMLDKRNNATGTHDSAKGSTEDEEDLSPVTPSYPRAAPGSLDLYHWEGMGRERMKEGSATEERMEKMKSKARTSTSVNMVSEDEEDLVPTAPSYPYAAPGSLDLYHWTDSGRENMKVGSAAEERMEKMKSKDQKKRMK